MNNTMDPFRLLRSWFDTALTFIRDSGYLEKGMLEWNGIELVATLVVATIVLRATWAIYTSMSLAGNSLAELLHERMIDLRRRPVAPRVMPVTTEVSPVRVTSLAREEV